MDNISWIEFNGYNSRKASNQSSLLCSANLARYEAHTKETTISSIPMVNGKLKISGSYEEGYYSNEAKALFFLFPSSFFIH